jgi:hypothetical protein
MFRVYKVPNDVVESHPSANKMTIVRTWLARVLQLAKSPNTYPPTSQPQFFFKIFFWPHFGGKTKPL